MIRTERNVFFAFVALTIGAGSLQAQVSEEAQLRELLEVYVRGEVLLGRIPEGSPLAAVIPSDARIIGSVERIMGSAGTTVLLGVRGNEVQVRQLMESALSEAGWTALERPLPGRGGFTMVHTGHQFSIFCGADGYISLNTSQGQPRETRVQVSLTGPDGGSPCERPGMDREIDSPLPTLSGPAGSRMQGGGTNSSGGRRFSSSASFDTSMPLSELAAEFGKQVEGQGWQQTSTRADSAVAVRTYTRTDQRLGRLHGTLFIVAPPGSSMKEAMFTVTSLTGRAR
jgi:hypothetical protein